jgi:glyoxylase-like metal-dependent hydrolase (beta-lactamase superfamily II)
MNLDFTQAIEIANNIYWIGMYLENDPFQCHPYFIKNGNASVLIDPGSMLEFDAVVEKINSISDMSQIKYIILHHQDPDLAASVPAMEKLINREDLSIVTHSRMVPLIKHYLIQSDYYQIDHHAHRLQEDGLDLQFITTPYCHSPGAFVSYCPPTKTLFSGDIFGGIAESWDFYAKEDYFEKAKQFHAEYMPSRDIFNYALKKMEVLDLEIIAPQHGSIILKEQIYTLIEQMKALECGLYLEDGYKNELLLSLSETQKHTLYLKEGVYWNYKKRKLFWHDTEIQLKPKEKIVLSLLASKANIPVSSVDIFEHLYENQHNKNFSSNAITSLMKRIRQKLPKETIKSAYGVGYILQTE